jgi:hypothetical protein
VHRLVRDDKNAAARCPLDAPGYPLTTTGPIWVKSGENRWLHLCHDQSSSVPSQ